MIWIGIMRWSLIKIDFALYTIWLHGWKIPKAVSIGRWIMTSVHMFRFKSTLISLNIDLSVKLCRLCSRKKNWHVQILTICFARWLDTSYLMYHFRHSFIAFFFLSFSKSLRWMIIDMRSVSISFSFLFSIWIQSINLNKTKDQENQRSDRLMIDQSC